MQTYLIRMQNRINGVIYTVPIFACSLDKAKQKAKDYPYNTFGDFIVL